MCAKHRAAFCGSQLLKLHLSRNAAIAAFTSPGASCCTKCEIPGRYLTVSSRTYRPVPYVVYFSSAVSSSPQISSVGVSITGNPCRICRANPPRNAARYQSIIARSLPGSLACSANIPSTSGGIRSGCAIDRSTASRTASP